MVFMCRARIIFVTFALLVSLLASPLTAQTTIDYTGVAVGDNINGDLLGNVIITSGSGNVSYLLANPDDGGFKAYGAPNVTGFPANGCLPTEGGFSDLSIVNTTSNTDHHYSFTFEQDGAAATVSSFQITMYDFGDFNPTGQTFHRVDLTALDIDGDLVDGNSFVLYTTSAVNPRDGGYSSGLGEFDPYFASDACDAGSGQPGVYTLLVSGEGIASVQLDGVSESDPKIAFGDVQFDLEAPSCDTTDTEVAFCAGQTEDIGTVAVTNDDLNLYVTFTSRDGWYLDETHVAVGMDLADIPQTKKGNPIPGRFPYACDDLEPLQTTCTVTIPLDEYGWCADTAIVVAAHAAVVEVAGDGCDQLTFWATEVGPYMQGTLKDESPVALDRSDPTAALFAPDWIEGGADGFYSLGMDLYSDDDIEAWLTVGFGHPIYNGPGDDIVVQEVTNGRGSYPEEKAQVFGVKDGTDYLGGVVSNNDGGDGLGSVDLGGGMTTFDSVKLEDATDWAIHASNADGYDVDAVGACYLLTGEETAWGDGCTGEPFVDSTWGTYFSYTINECAQCGD
jgi:hypothetical protein